MDNDKFFCVEIQRKLITEKGEVIPLITEQDRFKFSKWKPGPAPENNEPTLLPPYQNRNETK